MSFQPDQPFGVRQQDAALQLRDISRQISPTLESVSAENQHRATCRATAKRCCATTLQSIFFLFALLFLPGLALAQSGGTGASGDPYQITSLADLEWMATNVGLSSGTYYTLQNDIDTTATSSASYNSGQGFSPIGTVDDPNRFKGIFDGGGHTISNLTINRPGTDYVGLFGILGSGGEVKNLGVEGGSITGHYSVGGLVGWSPGPITNCTATGAVTGTSWVGGLVGDNSGGAITGCYATGVVTGTSYVGGLLGQNDTGGTITNCHATGTATAAATGGGYAWAGGLVGYNTTGGAITNCYATGAATATATVEDDLASAGGLVGGNSSTITNCYATGAARAGATVYGCDIYVGGLVGYNTTSGAITNCYATGAATGTNGVGELAGYVGGLVGHTDGAITNCHATGTATGGSAGGLVGDNNTSGAITNSYATGAATGDSFSGGLVGRNDTTTSSTIANCYATGAATGGYAGGLVGMNGSGRITTCYATGAAVTETGSAGGLVGLNSNGTFTACYWNTTTSGRPNRLGTDTDTTGGLSDAEMKDQTKFVGWNFATVWSIFPSMNGGYPYLPSLFVSSFSINSGAMNTATNAVTLNNACTNSPTDYMASESPTFTGATWQPYATAPSFTLSNGNGTKTVYFKTRNAFGESSVASDTIASWATVPCSGDGSAGSPYQISTLDHLNWVRGMANTGNSAGKHYTLTGDIDAFDTAWWNDASTTTGTLEGFMPIGTLANPFQGVFDGNGYVIYDLTINRTGMDYVGFFGYVGSDGVVKNVGVEGGSVTGRDYVGGLVGYSCGVITDCYAAGEVMGRACVGGLVGYNGGGTITNSYADGSVNAGDYVGGLVGGNVFGTITTCYATGEITGSGEYAGGLVGFNNYLGTLTNCYATGEATANSSSPHVYAGGLVGNNDGTITNCYATGAAAATATSGDVYVGGLVGQNDTGGSITNCYATGAAAATTAGGLGLAGGLVGENDGTITTCYATGAATATGGVAVVGGLLGRNGYLGAITNCYATGAATATGTSSNAYAGGLVGNNSGTITNCYATGAATATATYAFSGGLVGMDYSSITNCYWDMDTSHHNTSSDGTGLTDDQMKVQANFVGWDFSAVWGISSDWNNGYPYLRSIDVPSLTINGGAAATSSRVVTLNNTCVGEPARYKASEDANFIGATWLPYSTAPTFTLTSGAGTKTVYFKVSGNGKESAVATASINLNIALPTVSSFGINMGAGSATDATVVLNNVCANNPTLYMAAESSDFLTSSTGWLTYSSAPEFTLSSGSGTKTVYFKTRNDGGESAVKSDTIKLTETVTASLYINYNAASTDNPVVTLNSVCSGRPTQYMASDLPSFKGMGWKAYDSAATFPLSSKAGKKTVYFKVRNAAGTVSKTTNDTITLTPPLITVFNVNAGDASVTTRTVELFNTCSPISAPTEYMASETLTSLTKNTASWQPYSTMPTFTLSSGNAVKKVYFKVRNQYNVESAVKMDTIKLAGPLVSAFKINNGKPTTAVAIGSLNSVITGCIPTQYMASESLTSLTQNTASWNDYHTSVTFTLSSSAGVKTVYFKVRNSKGMESAIKSDTIKKTAVTSGAKPKPRVATDTVAVTKAAAVSSKTKVITTTDTPAVTTGGATTVVTTGTLAAPDLQVTDYALDPAPDGLSTIGTLRIANDGAADAGAFHVALYFWASDTLSLADAVLVQEVAVDGLPAGAETLATFTFALPNALSPVFVLDSQAEVAAFDAMSNLFNPNALQSVE